MRAAFWIVLGTAALVVALVATLKRTLRAVRREMEAAVSERFAPDEMLLCELDANFFGSAAAGALQARGNGALVLTRERLWFMLFMPRREFDIPLASVRSAGVRKSHLGKTCLVPLLFVEYETEDGKDSVAWAVRDAAEWAERVEEACS